MGILIDIDKARKEYSNLTDLTMSDTTLLLTLFSVLDNAPTVNAILIPDNATNGDVIKALFPNEIIELSSGYYENYIRNISFKYDWWNAPYKENKDGKTD